MRSYRTIFGVVLGAAGQPETRMKEDGELMEGGLRKNGFVNRGIQLREGFSTGVFRQPGLV